MSAFRPLDYAFLALSMALTAGSLVWVFGAGSKSGALLVQIQAADGTSLYPLSEPRDIKVPGPAGITWLRIERGEVFAVDSPGPLRVMMQMGKIRERGQWLASLPNKVFVRIVSASGDSSATDVDATVF